MTEKQETMFKANWASVELLTPMTVTLPAGLRHNLCVALNELPMKTAIWSYQPLMQELMKDAQEILKPKEDEWLPQEKQP